MIAEPLCSVTDIHCHLLPGVDDGSPTYEISVSALRSAVKCGVRDVILTPHFSCRRAYTMLPSDIVSHFQIFRNRIADENLPVRLYLGSEIEYAHDADRLLFSHSLLTMADSDFVLTEFDPRTSARDIRQGLRQIMSYGYRPILAHMERYPDLVGNPEVLEQLIDDNVFFQMNLCSLTGSRRSFCKAMLKHEVVDFISSDHHGSYPDGPSFFAALKKLKAWTSDSYFKNLTNNNAQTCILNQGE